MRFTKGQTIDMGGIAVTMHDAGTLHTFTSAKGTTYAPVLDSLPAMLRTGMIRTAQAAHA